MKVLLTTEADDTLPKSWFVKADYPISMLNYQKQLTNLSAKFLKRPSKASAKDLIDISFKYAGGIVSRLFDAYSIEKFYAENGELHLWKCSFYGIVEVFRKVVNTISEPGDAQQFKDLVVDFIGEAINFYMNLITTYESHLSNENYHFSDVFLWGVEEVDCKPIFDMDSLITVDYQIYKNFGRGRNKTIIRSVQRHFLSLGDLYRYKATFLGDTENMRIAKLWYFKAAQANMLNGRAFNQLSVLAAQSRNYMDIVFYYAMALSTKHPFGAARESLEIIFNDIRRLCDSIKPTSSELSDRNALPRCRHLFTLRRTDLCQQQLPSSQKFFGSSSLFFDQERRTNSGAGENCSVAAQEIWIMPNRPTDKLFFDNNFVDKIDVVGEEFSAKEQRNAIIRFLHAVGTLVTNIGMDEFDGLRAVVVVDLRSFLEIPVQRSLMNKLNLLKVCLLLIFANWSIKTGSTKTTLMVQRRNAQCLIFDLLYLVAQYADAVLSRMVADQLAEEQRVGSSNELYLTLDRVLPTLCILIEWLCTQLSNSTVLEEKDLNEVLTILTRFLNQAKQFVTKKDFCKNELKDLRINVACLVSSSESRSNHGNAVVLPEMFLALSFSSIFLNLDMDFLVESLDLSEKECKETPAVVLVRLRRLLSRVDSVLGRPLDAGFLLSRILRFSSSSGGYEPIIDKSAGKELLRTPDKGEGSALISGDRRQSDRMVSLLRSCSFIASKRPLVDVDGAATMEREDDSSDLDDDFVKNCIISEEQRRLQGQNIMVEVCPQYLVPDTNTFVDYLHELKQIVESTLFTILIPTTVIAELSGLSVNILSSSLAVGGEHYRFQHLPPALAARLKSGGKDRAIQFRYVIERTKVALEYLKFAAEHRLDRLATITSNGNILPRISFACEMNESVLKKTNDDKILAACVALCNRGEAVAVTPADNSDDSVTTLKRNVVLLTEDRALTVKALAARIPVKTVPQFICWSKI